MIWARRALIWSGVNETGVEGGRGAEGTGPDVTEGGGIWGAEEGGPVGAGGWVPLKGGSDWVCGTWPFGKGGCVWGCALSGGDEGTKRGAGGTTH